MKATLAAAAVLAAATAPAHAQLASPSTAALGMGDNYTAAARGYAAAAWNPALLGVAGNPGWSMTLFTGRGVAGLDPVTLGELADWEGRVVPETVRLQWLAAIRSEGSQAGTGGVDMTWAALQIGPVALQASSSARAVTDVSPGVAELLLFGNTDEQGEVKTINLNGSKLNGAAFTTVAAAYGHALRLGAPGSQPSVLAFGVTAKYTIGHFMALSRESTGQATADPVSLTLAFPIVHTPLDAEDDQFEGNTGNGFGVDAGVAYQTRGWTFGATVQNLVNTFEWDESLLRYRAGTLLFSADERRTAFDRQPLESAPAALRELVDDMTFKPSVALGAMLQASEQLRVSADARFGGAAGLSTRPATQIGAGAEYRVTSFLPVRAGAAFVQLDDDNAGFQLGGGIGVELGSFTVSASGLRRSTGLGVDSVFMLSLISVGM